MTLRKYSLVGGLAFLLSGLFDLFTASWFTSLISIALAVVIALFFFGYFRKATEPLVKLACLIGFVGYLIAILASFLAFIAYLSAANLGLLITVNTLRIIAGILTLLTFLVLCVKIIVAHQNDTVVVILAALTILARIIGLFVPVIAACTLLVFGALLLYLYVKDISF